MTAHPEAELVAYVAGELTPAARSAVEAHLAACADCRRERAALAATVAELRRSVPAPPPLAWGRYQAEVRARVTGGGRGRARRRVAPVSLALSGALAAGLLLMAAGLGERNGRPPADLAVAEEMAIGGRLELLRQYPVVEQLDLYENLEVIRRLDELAPTRGG
jgi:anti-sigma factor RsiW